MRLKTKLLLIIGIPILALFVTIQLLIHVRLKKQALQDAKTIANSYAKEYSSKIGSQLSTDVGIARGMANAFSGYDKLLPRVRDSIYHNIIYEVLLSNPKYIAVFLQWELNAIDESYHRSYGRRRVSLFRKQGVIQCKIDYLEMKGDDTSGIYYLVKSDPQEYVINPYFYSYSLDKALPSELPITEDAILETTIIVPILKNNRFVGMTGMDIPLNQFAEMLDTIHPFPYSYAFLASNNGKWVTHPDKTLVNTRISDENHEDEEKYQIEEKIKQGKAFSFVSEHSRIGQQAYVTFAPVKIGASRRPWSLGIVVPVDIILKEANNKMRFALIIGIIGIFGLLLIVWFIAGNISAPVLRATETLQTLARGEIDRVKKIPVKSNDELGKMLLGANKLIEGFNHTTQFAKEIGSGNLEAEYQMLSNNDIIGRELVQMRNNLKKSKNELEKLSIVASKTDNVVLIADKDGNIEWVNNSIRNAYGYKPIEVIGMKLTDFSSDKKVCRQIEDCIHLKKTVTYESQSTTKTGSKFWTQTTITPILENGNVIRLVAIDTDITNIKNIESEIRLQKERLEHLNAVKDKFFTIIAHDMKNPFASLISITNTLASSFNEIEKDELKFYLQRISNSTSLLHNLLDNLLQWATSQTGRIDFNPKEVDINRAISSICLLLKINAEKKHIKLEHFHNQPLKAVADNNMLQTVLRNLISNAIKYTNEGGIITVYARQRVHEVVVSVQDNGIGLNYEDIQKLFRIDVKTKSIGKSKEKGTGLGLILCKEFVERHGGTIWVESELGVGSTFSFSLPNRKE